MAKTKYKPFVVRDWENIQGDIKKLNKAMDKKLSSKGVINGGDSVFVDYVCLRDVLNFIVKAHSDFETLIKIRILLDT